MSEASFARSRAWQIQLTVLGQVILTVSLTQEIYDAVTMQGFIATTLQAKPGIALLAAAFLFLSESPEVKYAGALIS